MDVKDRFSTVTVREKKESVKVALGPEIKHLIHETTIHKWQTLIDTSARLVNITSALIMLLNENTIEVFLKSNTAGNPYKVGEKSPLIYGLYCETVIGTQKKLVVPDARNKNEWNRNNPDIDLNMISYLGFPINWPNGEVFGTVCLLDNKENHYNNDFEDLLFQVKQHIENDLSHYITNKELEKKNIHLEQLINTNSKFLSLISHDIRGSISTVDEVMKLIIDKYDSLDSQKLKTMLETLSKNVSSSSETLDNILNWSKNDIVQIKKEAKETNLVELIEGILSYYSQAIQLKGIRVISSFYTKKIVVLTDSNMLSVVLRNIISNAIKYTNAEGELYIHVGFVNSKHEITISDNGIGMSRETLDNLFSYNELVEKGTHGENSSGIGLMLAFEFINKLGAEVEVDSKLNKGTTFKLRI